MNSWEQNTISNTSYFYRVAADIGYLNKIELNFMSLAYSIAPFGHTSRPQISPSSYTLGTHGLKEEIILGK